MRMSTLKTLLIMYEIKKGLTFICNPSWQNVAQVLLPGQKATDCLTVQNLMNVVTKIKYLEKSSAIEWQKRGV